MWQSIYSVICHNIFEPKEQTLFTGIPDADWEILLHRTNKMEQNLFTGVTDADQENLSRKKNDNILFMACSLSICTEKLCDNYFWWSRAIEDLWKSIMLI